MSDPASSVERRSIDSLVPYDRNPRMHPDSQIDQLANSITQWGWTVPILIDDASNVIAGHGRLEAAKRLGMDEVPCVVASGWSEDQRRAYIIADNKLSENSIWDDGAFFNELKTLSESDFDLSLIGIEGFEPIEFVPNLEPTVNYNDVTTEDIAAAQSQADQGFRDSQARQASKGIDVICPSCAHEFRVEGQ